MAKKADASPAISAPPSAGIPIGHAYRLFELSVASYQVLPADRPEPRFSWLPYVAVEPAETSTWIEKFRPTRCWDPYPADRMRLLVALDWMLGREIDAVNLSLGFHGPFDRDEPLAVATRTLAERGIAVVVAAGNEGPEPDTLQELARAPWVVPVGATDPRDSLLGSSSRGAGGLGPGPLVVADGTPRPDDGLYRPMTSFAAPRVAEAVAFLRVCLHWSLLSLQSFQRGIDLEVLHLRRAVVAYADSGPYPSLDPPTEFLMRWLQNTGSTWVGLLRNDTERAWYDRVMQFVTTYGGCEITLLGDAMRRALQVVARPLPGYSAAEVGAGVIGAAEVNDFLTNLLPSYWLRIFCPATVEEGSTELRDLDQQLGPLWDPVQVASYSVLYPTVPDWATVATG